MTKIEAILQVLKDNGGTASLDIIYNNITKYYPTARDSREWEAGIRGVLYRELYKKRYLKKIGSGIYALVDYKQEPMPSRKDKVRMHTFIEGICLELGNFEEYITYTADPSALYRDNLYLRNVATLSALPCFSYEAIIKEVQRIDVIWLNKKGLRFPRKVFEIVDSVSTLNGAFNRSLQLSNFQTDFVIVAPEKHREKYNQTLELEIYQPQKDRFSFINYEQILELYSVAARKNEIESQIF